jgi:hypothetical protein
MKNKIKLLMVALVFVSINSVLANNISEPFDNNDGWKEVPLTDTSDFDADCEYQMVYANTDNSIVVLTSIIRLQSRILFKNSKPNQLVFLTAEDKQHAYYCNEGNCGPATAPFNNILLLQKRCDLPDTTPASAVMLFNLNKCPDGWGSWLMPEDINFFKHHCDYVICKKN